MSKKKGDEKKKSAQKTKGADKPAKKSGKSAAPAATPKVAGKVGKSSSAIKTTEPKKPATKPAAQKSTATAAAKPAAAKTASAAPTVVEISTEDISLRAYFIAERRRQLGWPGDELSDWTEAEKQLRQEALRKAKKGAK